MSCTFLFSCGWWVGRRGSRAQVEGRGSGGQDRAESGPAQQSSLCVGVGVMCLWERECRQQQQQAKPTPQGGLW